MPATTLLPRPHTARRLAIVGFSVAVVAALLTAPAYASTAGTTASSSEEAGSRFAAVLDLPGGARAYVEAGGHAVVVDRDGTVTHRQLRAGMAYDPSAAAPALPSRSAMIAQLSRPDGPAYAHDAVLVALTAGVTLDAALASVGGTSAEPVLVDVPAGLSPSSATTLASVYEVRLSGMDAEAAAEVLASMPGVAWSEPAWSVEAGDSASVVVPPNVLAAGRSVAERLAASVAASDARGLPRNYGVRSGAQGAWMTPGLDAGRAFDTVTRQFGLLPGAGEIITTVGVGGITSDPTGPCAGDVSFFGPTTTVIDGQRYLDLPSMPLIPTYTADRSGVLDPLGEACPITDPLLEQIGLGLSVSAPLPHALQRAGAIGAGLTDLLGLAPGAAHRLVVPASAAPTTKDVGRALLAAAMQSPPPTVITCTVQVGGDDVGFPSRMLEDDPFVRSIVSTIVNDLGITVVLPAGDGTTTRTTAAVGPSGGAALTERLATTQSATKLADLRLSTAPSQLPDTGAIVVAASTTNDVFAQPPQYAGAAAKAQQAYPTTRWTGSTTFASGRGSRVDVSAPGDSILGLFHQYGGSASSADVQLGSSTSAAAAEVAAAAAVGRQVARLTGHPLTDPAAVRSLLKDTARDLPDVPQASPTVPAARQIDLGAMVDALLAQAGIDAVDPGVVRVAVAQRRPVAAVGGIFASDTDPSAIDMSGPPSPVDGSPTGRNTRAWLTIAPDWVGLPAGATYTLRVVGGGLLARTSSARLQPAEILAAAGLPLGSKKPRKVVLTYTAFSGSTALASVEVPLTFGPATGLSAQVLAPAVAPVATGATISVGYDLRDVAPLKDDPELIVSHAGRTNPATGTRFTPAVVLPVPDLVGTIDVPVSALDGNGIYGIGIHYADQEVEGFITPLYSDFAFVRVEAAPTAAPPAPLVGVPGGGAPDHLAVVPYAGQVTVSWDVRGVPGATGARLEVSAAGPTIWNLLHTFSNPEGSARDDNGVDSPSVTTVALPGRSGTKTFAASQLDLFPGMTHGVRVLPLGAGGAAAGSASAVSSVRMDGVRPRSGGIVEEGFSIDPTGSAGLLTSERLEPGQPARSSVEVFDQQTAKITARPLDSTGHLYTSAGTGVFGGHAALVVERDPFTWAPAASWRLDDVGQADPKPWSVPKPSRYRLESGGSDAPSRTGAFLLRDAADAGSGPYRLTFGDVPAATFGPVRDISADFESLPSAPQVGQIAYAAKPGVAVVTFPDPVDFYGAPYVEAVAQSSGDVRRLTLDTVGMPMGMDVLADPTRAVISTFDYRLSVVDVATGVARSIPMPGGTFGQYVAADDAHGLFLVFQAAPADIYTNNNALSEVHVFDADLEEVDVIKRFNFYDTPLSPRVQQLQVDPRTRTAWTVGRLQEQVVPFGY